MSVTKHQDAPHILLVEDEPELSRIYSGVLSRAGYRVTAVHSVSEAIDILKEEPILLVVTDWYLPDGNGSSVCEKAREQNPQMPVLLISGQANTHTLLENSTVVNAWLSKPVLADSLLSTVSQLLKNNK